MKANESSMFNFKIELPSAFIHSLSLRLRLECQWQCMDFLQLNWNYVMPALTNVHSDSGTSASNYHTQFPIIQVAEIFFDKESDVHITSLYLISLQVRTLKLCSLFLISTARANVQGAPPAFCSFVNHALSSPPVYIAASCTGNRLATRLIYLRFGVDTVIGPPL